jgi:hypothetical protein
MARYLVSVNHPADFESSSEDQATRDDITALNHEMVAAGVRVFVGGLEPVSGAKSIRATPDGKVLVTDGPYIETKEYLGGFWVLEVPGIEEALEWGRKAAIACRVRIEVRAFG